LPRGTIETDFFAIMGQAAPGEEKVPRALHPPPEGGLADLIVGADVQALGMRANAPPPGRVIIAYVEAGSWADGMGIIKGTELIAIDHQDVQLMSTQVFVEAMKKRPMHLTVMAPPVTEDGLPKFPVKSLDTDELDYALGYDPNIERAKRRPNALHGAPRPGYFGQDGQETPGLDQWSLDVAEQRRRLQELTRVCDRARADTLELRQRKAHHAAEVARLEQLVAFGDDPTYCRNCDLRMLNLQVLLRALGRVSLAVFADFAYGTGDYEILAECAESLNGAAYLDTQIAELASYLTESLPQVPSLPPSQPPRKLWDVLPETEPI